jgi:2-deoxy-D-gluconate 3-dehydrogenase
MQERDAALAQLLVLDGRTAVVTGAGMGIGRAIARRLAEAGAAVVVADADAEAAEVVAKELGEQTWEARAVRADVSSAEDVAHLVEETVAWRGGIDVLVNNAGIFPAVPVLEMTPAQFERVIAVNLEGVYLCCSLVGQQMVSQGYGGRIINITSVDATHPSSIGLAHYDASKHGVWGFTKNLALELAPHRIWVNAIAPGGIHTPGATSMKPAPGVDPAELMARFTARIPMGRMGEPDEIAKVALFLAGEMASYLTGSQIVVDGGVLLS